MKKIYSTPVTKVVSLSTQEILEKSLSPASIDDGDTTTAQPIPMDLF